MCIILTSIFCYPAYGTETARKIIWFCPDLRGTALFLWLPDTGNTIFISLNTLKIWNVIRLPHMDPWRGLPVI